MAKINSIIFREAIESEGLERIDRVLNRLERLGIDYSIWYHPPLPTIEIAMEYWKEMPGTHCKNLFFRNHKGDRHYLVVFECSRILDIHSLEKMLRQGKLSFASEKRMATYLGLKPGSVSPFGLMNDTAHHVKLYLGKELMDADLLSFHPNDNRASVLVSRESFFRFLSECGNEVEVLNENFNQ